MNIRHVVAPLAVALVAGGTITASAAGAFAATPSPAPSTSASAHAHRAHLGKDATLQQVQAAAASATSKRITKLNAAITKATADKTLTSSDRSTLLSTLQSDLAGMKQLQTKIAADTTASQAHTDYTTIFRQYRVLAVALPQERIVREADRAAAKTVPHLQAAEQKLSARLTKEQDKATPAAKAALADLQQQITTVQSDAQGLGSAALAVTPAQFDQSHTAFSAVRSKAKALRTAAKAAQKDIRTIRQSFHH